MRVSSASRGRVLAGPCANAPRLPSETSKGSDVTTPQPRKERVMKPSKPASKLTSAPGPPLLYKTFSSGASAMYSASWGAITSRLGCERGGTRCQNERTIVATAGNGPGGEAYRDAVAFHAVLAILHRLVQAVALLLANGIHGDLCARGCDKRSVLARGRTPSKGQPQILTVLHGQTDVAPGPDVVRLVVAASGRAGIVSDRGECERQTISS